MKRLLLPLLAALALPTAVNANVDPQVNEMCLKAADYKGCVELNTKKSNLPKCNWFRKDNCFGEIIYNNATYKGEISDKKPNGYGIITMNNGYKYEGQWKNGVEDGYGTYIEPSGSKYAGEVKNGVEDGYGTYIWPSGSKYTGEWKNGERTGQGTYYWPDGSSWTGQFLNSKRTENGSYNYSKEEKDAARKMQLEMMKQTNDLMKSIYGNNQRIDLFMY